MPTVVTRAMVGLSAGLAVLNRMSIKRMCVLCAICAVLPDADVIGFRLGIPYSHFFGHRGYSHSICFAFLVVIAVLVSEFRWVWIHTLILGVLGEFCLLRKKCAYNA
jgi:inner membrane protein